MRCNGYERLTLRQILTSVIMVFIVLLPGVVNADNYSQLIQYEFQFGNRSTVSNFYLSMQPQGLSRAKSSHVYPEMTMRTPLFSTDPHKLTLLRPFSILRAQDEDGDTQSGVDQTNSNTAGQAVGSVLLVLLYVAPIVYAVSESVSDFDPCGEGCEVDIPELPPLPEPPDS